MRGFSVLGAAKYGIRKVYVFGSVARGESNPASDIDLLIEMEAGASAFGVGAKKIAEKMKAEAG